MDYFQKINTFITKHASLLLGISIGIFVTFFGLVAIWKYNNFLYNGLDLAIYNQVFFNSIHGRWFQFSIHPQLYLGDHLELFILALLPIYYFFSHPLTLVFIQLAFLALSAWPLYLIARKTLSPSWSLLISQAWLLNPYLQNSGLFEFHLLPLAILFIFWTYYFWQNKKFWPFLVCFLISLTIREDVSLVLFFFSLLAWWDKRSKKWIIWPALISALWFVVAMKVIGHFSPDGAYKFFYYYRWLGSSWPEVITTLVTNPLMVLVKLSTWQNLGFTLCLFVPVCFLNLKKPLFLLPAILIYLQIIMAGFDNSVIALKTHYVSLILPWIYLSLIYSLPKLGQETNNFWLKLLKNKALVVIFLLSSSIYSCLALGPIIDSTKALTSDNNQLSLETSLKEKLLSAVPEESPLVASYDFLTKTSFRQNLYSLHYVYIGKKQFSDQDYLLPPNTEYILMDTTDFLTYGQQFPNNSAWQNYFENGDNNLRRQLSEQKFKVIKALDSYLLLAKNSEQNIPLYGYQEGLNNKPSSSEEISLVGWTNKFQISDTTLATTLFFKLNQATKTHYQISISWLDSNGEAKYQKNYALAYGLLPTSDWETNKVLAINYWLALPENLKNKALTPAVQIISQKGYLTLDNFGQAVLKTTDKKIGQNISLNQANYLK